MSFGRTIEGIDRFLLIAGALVLTDIPQIVMYFFPPTWLLAWLWGVVGSLLVGMILNNAFNVRLFGPRIAFKVIVFVLIEMLPGIGMLSLLSVALLLVIAAHNWNVAHANE